jgi:hypothetical protein
MKRENVFKTWWGRTSRSTKLMSILPFIVIIPFLYHAFKEGVDFPLIGWISGGVITLGILSGIIYANVSDWKNNK